LPAASKSVTWGYPESEHVVELVLASLKVAEAEPAPTASVLNSARLSWLVVQVAAGAVVVGGAIVVVVEVEGVVSL
jgi:hypothetical protein